jgi:galactokinase
MTEPTDLPDFVDTTLRRVFGDTQPHVWFAPGRLNLIGAHLDYNGGDVLPLAVDLGVFVGAALREDGRIRLVSHNQTDAVELATDEVSDRRRDSDGWASYPLGVWQRFRARTGTALGVDLAFAGNLPMASGMSSSAAIEVATAFALDDLYGTGLSRLELARICHEAETRYVEVHCGIMDQFASALGRAGHALLLHCHDQRYEHVEIHGSGFEILVMDTKKPRKLAESGFNLRVRECGKAHEILRARVRDLPFLAAYGPEDLAAAEPHLPETLLRRARHVVREMARVQSAVEALHDGRTDLLGACLSQSHRSASEDYEVSCEELDFITATACEHPSVFGARLTGAGFGGCAVALIEPDSADGITAHVRAAFLDRFGVDPEFMLLHAGDGPRRLA